MERIFFHMESFIHSKLQFECISSDQSASTCENSLKNDFTILKRFSEVFLFLYGKTGPADHFFFDLSICRRHYFGQHTRPSLTRRMPTGISSSHKGSVCRQKNRLDPFLTSFIGSSHLIGKTELSVSIPYDKHVCSRAPCNPVAVFTGLLVLSRKNAILLVNKSTIVSVSCCYADGFWLNS